MKRRMLFRLLVGSYTRKEGHVPNGEGEGISIATIESIEDQQPKVNNERPVLNLLSSSVLEPKNLPLVNPSYLAVVSRKNDALKSAVICAVQETGDAEQPGNPTTQLLSVIDTVIEEEKADQPHGHDEKEKKVTTAAEGKYLSAVPFPTSSGNCHVAAFPAINLGEDGEGVFLPPLVLVSGYVSGTVGAFRSDLGIPTSCVEKEEEKSNNSCFTPQQVITFDKPSNVNKQRQEASHAHCCTVRQPSTTTNHAAQQQFVYVCDLGADCVWILKRLPSSASRGDDTSSAPLLEPLSNHNQQRIDLPPGSGPRHMIFTRDGQFAFVVGELSGTVYVLKNSSEGNEGGAGGMMELIGQASVMPSPKDDPTVSGRAPSSASITPPLCAAIVMHPSERYLYVSNRTTENTISVFRVIRQHATTSLDRVELELVQVIPCGGITPRDMCIVAPRDEVDNGQSSSSLLAVANQDSSNVAFFEIGDDDGNVESGADGSNSSSSRNQSLPLRFLGDVPIKTPSFLTQW